MTETITIDRPSVAKLSLDRIQKARDRQRVALRLDCSRL